jgi:acetolactate decarboxylase
MDSSLDPTLRTALNNAAARTGRDPQAIMESALREYLTAHPKGHNAVYLSAPVNALVEGLYEQNTTFTELKQHGDFGLGTFNDLDGEMIMLDGRIHQIRADGTAPSVNENEKTPFACVTFFNPDSFDDIEGELAKKPFEELLDMIIPSRNMLYAIRLTGDFEWIKARSVPRQANYRPLADVAKEQTTFEFTDCRGTLAGFFTPDFMSSVNVPGYHLHYLSHDQQHGGHLLACRIRKARLAIQHIPRLVLGLPLTFDYLTTDFKRNTDEDLQQAEHDH